MTRKQEKYFEERLHRLVQQKRDAIWDEPTMPPAVKKANDVVIRWKAQCTKNGQQKRRRLDEQSNAILKAIYFGTVEEVERALTELEKFNHEPGDHAPSGGPQS